MMEDIILKSKLQQNYLISIGASAGFLVGIIGEKLVWNKDLDILFKIVMLAQKQEFIVRNITILIPKSRDNSIASIILFGSCHLYFPS